MKSSQQRITFPYDTVVQLLGIYLPNTKTVIQKDIYISVIFAVLTIIAKMCEQNKCPTMYEWIKKYCVYANTILCSYKEECAHVTQLYDGIEGYHAA